MVAVAMSAARVAMVAVAMVAVAMVAVRVAMVALAYGFSVSLTDYISREISSFRLLVLFPIF